jgi:hypothetical protein
MAFWGCHVLKCKVLLRDSTFLGITKELLSAGIAKKDIVLGFHEPKIRQYTGFAVA